MNKRILIIGGVAGGASVAARARRLDAGAEIIMFERGQHVSFSNCALPYYLSGVVGNSDALVMMSPEKFKKSYDIDARVNSEVMAINRDKKTIEIKNTLTGDIHEEAYDVLVMAPGASPVKPRSIGGIDGKNVYTVRNVADIVHLKDGLEAAGAENTAVIGGGFIGIEVAENLAKAGKKVTVVEAMSQILAPFDYDMVQMLHKELLDNGVSLIVDDGVKTIEEKQITLASGKTVPADAVILAIGVAPETGLAKAAGLEIGETGGILVDHNYRTSDKNIYAVGDAIEVFDRMTGKPSRLALAGPALRQARAAADSPSMGMHSRMMGDSSRSVKLAPEPTRTVPSASRVMGFSSGRSWMSTSREKPSNSRSLMSTSVPPAMRRASGSSPSSRMASLTDSAFW